MSKRKYFSWTDELRAELREYVDTHKKNKTEALKEAAEVFGVSLGSCNGAYAYEPKKPIVTEVDPEDLEPRENGTRIRKAKGRLMTLGELIKQSESKTAKMYMETEFDNMEAEKHPLYAEVERLQDELDEAYKQQEQMLEDITAFHDSAISVFTHLEFGTGSITLHDISYHLHTLVRKMNHKYGHKPKLVEE
jgi:hypothetical protein